MVPSLNFTVRPRPFEAKLAASADAPDSAAVVALTAVNDTLRAVQYPANSRRFSDLVSSLFPVIPFHCANRARWRSGSAGMSTMLAHEDRRLRLGSQDAVYRRSEGCAGKRRPLGW